MNSNQKLLQLQSQVRQNAEVVKNTLNDLYNWEKEIKDKEKNIIENEPGSNKEIDNFPLPTRNHIKQMESKSRSKTTSAPSSCLGNDTNSHTTMLPPSGEKQDKTKDPLVLKHKEANEMKDRGNKFVKSSEYITAIEFYTQAIQLYENDAVYYSNRALCYLKLERYDECIADCERAIEIDRLAVKAYYRRMMANESLGNNMDALTDCTTILTIEPKNTEAKRSLERINDRLRKNVKSNEGPNFSPLRTNVIDIFPIDKPPYKRSTKPLMRLAISDVIEPKESKNCDNLTISDDDIDKLFNTNCGFFEEIKEDKNKFNKTHITVKEEVKNSSKYSEKEAENISFPNEKQDADKIEEQFVNKAKRALPPPPTSTGQFYSTWREFTPKQKYSYLKSIPLSNLCKILGAGFDSDTLTDIINTLHDFYLFERDESIAKTLLEVSKNKQVSILSLLMSEKERKLLSEVVKYVKECNALDAASVEQITRNFNFN